MKARMLAYDWSSTSLGAAQTWPAELRTLVQVMLDTAEPASILWGEERIQLYNDVYMPIAGSRHPVALGRPAGETWSEAYRDFLAPTLHRAFAGETVHLDRAGVSLRAPDGGAEERHFTASFVPIRDEAGLVAGVYHTLTEVTRAVRVEQELRQREERLDRVLGGMAEGFGLLAPDFTILECNGGTFVATGTTARISVFNDNSQASQERLWVGLDLGDGSS